MDKFWVTVLWLIDSAGDQLGSRDGQSFEIIGFSEVMSNVNQTFVFNKIRKLSPYYACAEFLWYLSMTNDTSFLQLFAPGYKRFTEDGTHAFGAYGSRWVWNAGDDDDDQITLAIETLQRHPESRQVIITMWDGTDLVHARDVDKKDLPCTLSLQFLLRNGYLHQIVTMRSNDAWLGLPYDVFCFTQLQKLLSDILEVSPGSYVHNAGSMHFYERDREKITEILDSHTKDLVTDAPTSRHKKGTSNLDWKEQVTLAIDFVEIALKTPELEIQNTFLCDLINCHSTIADAALVCASKVNPKYADYIYDPQLRRARDEQE